ncbi:UNVERIFIED_CONTAM: hypothetical protein Slati_2747800 [Sesamum latifolium]|uniref:Reverse transcriptase domain-containing protein n=1 Tax=Sesamum latifolium TaxID=2727402 RepID=A0AAW2VZ09_9LAMI
MKILHRGRSQRTKEKHGRDPKGAPPNMRGKDDELEEESEGERGMPSKVQLAEELLNIELISGDSKKTTRIDSQMNDATRKEVVQYLQRNVDIFAWTPQDLEGSIPTSLPIISI